MGVGYCQGDLLYDALVAMSELTWNSTSQNLQVQQGPLILRMGCWSASVTVNQGYRKVQSCLT